MKNVQPSPERLSSARVFTEKYEWMLKWALQFTRNDRSLAEDLVQETFLRVSRSYPFLDEVRDVEALLYVSLKNAYLSELRRSRRHLFEDLDAIEYDSAVQSLRESRFSDAMAVQNELRRVAAYLCWRNQVTKPPSILILRFFHECLPNEIAHIAQLSRKAVTLALLRGRQELHAYLTQAPGAARFPQDPSLLLFPKRQSVSSAELLDELFATIYESRRTACLTREQLQERYRGPLVQPIGCELLSHIVSCRQCLRIVRNEAGNPSSTNTPYEPFNKGRELRPILKEGALAKRTLDALGRKLLAIYEHEPRSLIVLANSEVMATRDVNSSLCTLKIEAKSEKPLELIEIMSEQGFCLLSLFVEVQPPSAPPTLRRTVQFSLDRSLEAVLRFTAEGPIIEVVYSNPSYVLVVDPVGLSELEAELNDTVATSGRFHEEDQMRFAEARAAGIKRAAAMVRRGFQSLFPAWRLAFGILLLSAAAIVGILLRPKAPSTMEFLADVQRSKLASAGKSGIVAQRIQIKTSEGMIERTLHRDARGVRVAKQPKQRDSNVAKLQLVLASAGVSWEDPLASSTFKDWHDHAHVVEEHVSRVGKDLLSLTTDTSDGLIAEESLTVRTADFHPVGRAIHFRDSSTVEIAELSYEVLPWSPAGEEWFEPLSPDPSSDSRKPDRIRPTLHLPAAPTEDELNDAELSTRLVLAQHHADTGEQIEVSRQANGILVEGLVEAAERKQELTSALKQIDYVVPSIRTFEDLSNSPGPQDTATSVQAVESAAVSPLEKELLAAGWDHDRVGVLIRRLFMSAVATKQDAKTLTMLLDRYDTATGLTVRGQMARDALTIHYKAKLLEDIDEEQRALANSSLISEPIAPSGRTDLHVGSTTAKLLTEEARRNLDLYNELLSSDAQTLRTPKAIMTEMRQASDRLEAEAAAVDLAHRKDPGISSSLAPKK